MKNKQKELTTHLTDAVTTTSECNVKRKTHVHNIIYVEEVAQLDYLTTLLLSCYAKMAI